MTRGVRAGILTCTDLRNRLNLNIKTDKTKLEDLLKQCKDQNLITEDEFKRSIPLSDSTIKCYLYSVVTDLNHRDKIEQCVQQTSLLFTRGSFIANFIALEIFGDIKPSEKVSKFSFDQNDQVTQLYDFIENDNFKQCFLPERWPSSKVPREPIIDNILQKYPHLNTLLPDWKSLMVTSGWDNSINRMYSKYRANVQNHIMVHLLKYIKSYLKVVELEQPDCRDDLISCFYGKPRPIIAHNQDYEYFIALKQYLGVSDTYQYLPKKLEYNPSFVQLFMFLVKYGVTQGTYLPIANIGRKYCYFDAKIIQYLLPTTYRHVKQQLNREPMFAEILNITPESYNHKRKLIRKQLRQKYKKDNKKLKKKWKRLGHSNIPRNCKIYSMETDGVGLSLCIKRPIDIYHKHQNQEDNISRLDNPTFAGADLGRAKLFTAAVSVDGTKKPISIVFTRRQYYHDIKHRIRMKWEKQRSSQEPLRQVLIELSSQGGQSNLLHYTQVISQNLEVLQNEYSINKERALWKMRLYRLKKRSLDTHVNKILQLCKNRPVVIGLGDATFATSGRGELSVPTCQLGKAFLKAKRRHSSLVVLKSISEFGTTKGCCACSQVTTPKVKANGRTSTRLRLCTSCNETIVKLRDRDVQAARNILWLTQHEFFGCERPAYLCRQPRT